MGFFLLGLFAAIEIGWLVFTFVNAKQKEKGNWLKNRVTVRAVELLLFLLVLLLLQAAWDIRFKMCFFVLLVRVVWAGAFAGTIFFIYRISGS